MESPSSPPSSDPTPRTSQSFSNSFRFPTPIADERVSSWIQDTSATVMSSRSEDEGNLGDSAYEFIDTDEDSRDDNATESIASTDLDRPDDIASLADTEQSAEDSGEEDNPVAASIPALPSLDHEDAFNTPTLGGSSAVVDDFDRQITQSIEFEEPFSLGAETVSVKHTVADLNEEQTTKTMKDMKLQNLPQRLLITIRQTMTKQGLSTREPLRILYVGSHAAKQDIIHKIASSITASVETGKRAQRIRQSSSQIYNVVPVSAFGSERTPEIELMHSSGYQIKVEDCTAAQNFVYEDTPEKPDALKMTIDDNVTYVSYPGAEGFSVHPFWELPHVGIFYCSDSDSIDTRRTRILARKFMSRHGVPSIVISHKQLFDRSQCMSLDQHSVHMCLESRNPNGRGNLIHQRLPIDLASFLNIDARQMNRNLAYLTGLYEPLEKPVAVSLTTKSETSPALRDIERSTYLNESVNFIRTRTGAELRALLPFGLLILSAMVTFLATIPSYRSSSVPAISINSKTMSAVCISSTAAIALSSTTPKITSSPTSVAIKTSTQTVTVTKSPGPNSLSVLPSMELGTLPKVVKQSSASNKSLCTAEILGHREILIRIPSTTKLSWLTKEAMSVNITRNNVTVDTERVYSSDDGIVLLLAKNEAYGLLNISIVTTRKPRVNETFQIDFGSSTSQAWQNIVGELYSLLSEDVAFVGSKLSDIKATVDEMVEDAWSKTYTFNELVGYAKAEVLSAGNTATETAKSVTLEAAKRSAIISKEIGLRLGDAETQLVSSVESLQHLKEPWNNVLLKAQIQSKLAWLKMQGKTAEYQEYQRRAEEATKTKVHDTKKSRADARIERKAARAAKKEAREGHRGYASKRSAKKIRK